MIITLKTKTIRSHNFADVANSRELTDSPPEPYSTCFYLFYKVKSFSTQDADCKRLFCSQSDILIIGG